MRPLLFATTMMTLLTSLTTFGQGEIFFNTGNCGQSAPTRIGTPNGPLAGFEILGQLLAGPEPNSLTPVGGAQPHSVPGYITAGVVTVLNVSPPEFAFVKMVVWNATLWGNSLGRVPPDQLGMTDTVRMPVGGFLGNPPVLYIEPPAPCFSQSAIVPIPEPSVIALTVAGGFSLFVLHRSRHGGTCPR